MRLSALWRSGCTYNGIRSIGEKVLPAERKMPVGIRYNLRPINSLEGRTGSVKTGHYFHRHSQGTKEKSFVPVGE